MDIFRCVRCEQELDCALNIGDIISIEIKNKINRETSIYKLKGQLCVKCLGEITAFMKGVKEI